MNRRGFLLGLVAAPAVVKYEWLMPVRRVIVPERMTGKFYYEVMMDDPSIGDIVMRLPSGRFVVKNQYDASHNGIYWMVQ